MVDALFNLKAASHTEITHECGPRHIRVLIIDEGLSRVSSAIRDGAHLEEAAVVCLYGQKGVSALVACLRHAARFAGACRDQSGLYSQ